MAIHPIRLIAIDLDGTLLNEELHISQRVRDTLTRAMAQGVHVTLATGRSYASARTFARQLGINLPIITYQGGVVTDPVTDETLYHRIMDTDIAHAVVQQAEIEDLDISFYIGSAVYFRQLRYPKKFYDSWFSLVFHHEPDLHSVVDRAPPMKFIIIAEPDEADRIEHRWKRHFEDRLTIVRSHRLFVEGNPIGVSKGTALAWLAHRLGIPQTQVMAIGDNDNDRSMLEWAGLGVAMGSGAPSLHAVADWVAPGVEEDGVAVALDRFVLGPRLE